MISGLEAQKTSLIVSFNTQLSPKYAGESPIDGLLVSCLAWERKKGKKNGERNLKYHLLCALALVRTDVYGTGFLLFSLITKLTTLPNSQVHSSLLDKVDRHTHITVSVYLKNSIN